MLNKKVFNNLNISEIEFGRIKNIIFDLGGVIININFQNTINAFRKLGLSNFETLYSLKKQSGLFDLLETGNIAPESFYSEIRKLKPNVTDQDIKLAWCAMLLDMPEKHVAMLKAIRSNYSTYLLSNTNAIHIEYFNDYLIKSFGINPLPDMFDKLYYSHEIKQRKPNASAYEAVLFDSKLKPYETLFIDDLYANIDGARKAGLYAYHLENEEISDLFDK